MTKGYYFYCTVESNQFLFHMHSSEDANGAVIYVILSIYSVIHVYNLFLI